jgi:hypothetical protein
MARTSSKGLKVSVASGLLCTQRRIKVSLTKVLTGPKGSRGRLENFRGVSRPVGTNVRRLSGPMKPFPGRTPGEGLIGHDDVGSTGAVGLGFRLKFNADDATTNREVNLRAIAGFHKSEVLPFGAVKLRSTKPTEPKQNVAETGQSQFLSLARIRGCAIPSVQFCVQTADVSVQ